MLAHRGGRRHERELRRRGDRERPTGRGRARTTSIRWPATRRRPPRRRTPVTRSTRSRPASPAAPAARRVTGCGSSPGVVDAARRAGRRDLDARTRAWPRTSTRTSTTSAARLGRGHLGGARLRRRLGRRPDRAADGARADDGADRHPAGDRRGARRRRARRAAARAARPSPRPRSTTPTGGSWRPPSTSGSRSTRPPSAATPVGLTRPARWKHGAMTDFNDPKTDRVVARRRHLPGLRPQLRRRRRRRHRRPAPASPRGCPTCATSASTRSGSRRSTPRRSTTTATTSPTTATSTRSSARSPTPTR